MNCQIHTNDNRQIVKSSVARLNALFECIGMNFGLLVTRSYHMF